MYAGTRGLARYGRRARGTEQRRHPLKSVAWLLPRTDGQFQVSSFGADALPLCKVAACRLLLALALSANAMHQREA